MPELVVMWQPALFCLCLSLWLTACGSSDGIVRDAGAPSTGTMGDGSSGSELPSELSADAASTAPMRNGSGDGDAAGNDAETGSKDPGLRSLAQSLEDWNELSKTKGDTYWYEEENCVLNANEGTITIVQIEAGKAILVGTQTIARAECTSHVNRYEDFTPQTFPQLYDECVALIDREGAGVTVSADARGVVQDCSYPGDPTRCTDNCGEGFHIRSWGFGIRP